MTKILHTYQYDIPSGHPSNINNSLRILSLQIQFYSLKTYKTHYYSLFFFFLVF
ncbi:unnamed protein product [Brassica napus]|uniref:(rape) hypothetical protein n=1 Tax=Brassica napus TaxID=3708 RepID=A0A816PYR8_BRANA|nr:unnamed protein product [Brassica napus]